MQVKLHWRFILSVKTTIFLILVVCSNLILYGEIIKFSELKGEKPNFSIKRDIFSAEKMQITDPSRFKREMLVPTEKVKKVEKDIEAEIRQGVFFEGYIIKNTKNHALLSVNGEFFIVCERDIILNKIKILKIEKKKVIIEVESKKFEIKLKGDKDD